MTAASPDRRGLLLDAGGLYAALERRQREHGPCRAVLESHPGPLLLSPFVLAEVDYLVAARLGVRAEATLLDEVARGAYRLVPVEATDVADAVAVVRAYEDLRIGLADASLVVLSRRYRCLDLLSLDERHFRVLPGHSGRPFRILPADA